MKDETREKIEKLLSEEVTFMDLKTKQASKYSLEPNVRKYLADQLKALIQEEKQELLEEIKKEEMKWATIDDPFIISTRVSRSIDKLINSLKEEGKEKLK